MSAFPIKYKLLEDLRSPSVKPDEKSGKLIFRAFKKGTELIGIDHKVEGANPQVKYAPVILVFDQWLIPKNKLESLQTEVKSEDMPEKMRNIVDDMVDNSLKDKILNSSNGYAKGFVVGGVVGIGAAMLMKKGLLGYVLFGFGFGIVGALSGQAIADKFSNNN